MDWTDYLVIFPGAMVPHHCQVYDQALLNISVPWTEETGLVMPDKCHQYVNFTQAANETEDCTDGWAYDTSEMNTIVNEVTFKQSSYYLKAKLPLYYQMKNPICTY